MGALKCPLNQNSGRDVLSCPEISYLHMAVLSTMLLQGLLKALSCVFSWLS